MTKSERAALREHWRQIVTECENRDASISKRAWCEEHGIVLRLLYYWQRQFREGNDEPQSTPAFLDLTDVWEERHEKPGESSSIPFDPVLMIQTGNCSIYIGAVAKTETVESIVRVIGTTIFYVAGIVLVLGAAAVIIARRKAEQE